MNSFEALYEFRLVANQFKLKEKIGEGGFGIVFKGKKNNKAMILKQNLKLQ